ncbi:MAG TPA: cohesin domain-containing protein [Candidatus Saccharimonadia bacterium]|nr:cohesin domain-containing protein [Candidatus Saccharimonadia bacterium]
MPRVEPNPPSVILGKYWPLTLLAVVLVLGGIGAVVYQNRTGHRLSLTPTPSAPAATPASTATLYLFPAAGTITAGGTLTIEIRENSGAAAVNAVQANFTYPADKLDFVSADAATGAFSIAAESTGQNGLVKIARGTIKPVSSDHSVAKVTFRAKTTPGTAALSFAAGSALISTPGAANILGTPTGATLTIK